MIFSKKYANIDIVYFLRNIYMLFPTCVFTPPIILSFSSVQNAHENYSIPASRLFELLNFLYISGSTSEASFYTGDTYHSNTHLKAHTLPHFHALCVGNKFNTRPVAGSALCAFYVQTASVDALFCYLKMPG